MVRMVATSSSPMRRLYPWTSVLKIAASLRSMVSSPGACAYQKPLGQWTTATMLHATTSGRGTRHAARSHGAAGAERLLPRPCRTGEGPQGLARQHHWVHVVVVPIGEPEGGDAVGQQYYEIAPESGHIGDLEGAPGTALMGHRPERQVVPSRASRQPTSLGLIQGLGQFGGTQELLALMLPAVLQQGGELRHVVDGHIQAECQQRDTAPAIALLCMHDGRMEDTERLEDLSHDHVPQVGLRAGLTLQKAVHRRGQDKGVRAVIAQHFPGPPRIFAIGETDIQLFLGGPRL